MASDVVSADVSITRGRGAEAEGAPRHIQIYIGVATQGFCPSGIDELHQKLCGLPDAHLVKGCTEAGPADGHENDDHEYDNYQLDKRKTSAAHHSPQHAEGFVVLVLSVEKPACVTASFWQSVSAVCCPVAVAFASYADVETAALWMAMV